VTRMTREHGDEEGGNGVRWRYDEEMGGLS
jgi:hypothetical protein